MYLFQKVYDAYSNKDREILLHTIKSGSVVAWQHVNLQAEYDLSEEILNNSMKFRLPELLELQVALNGERDIFCKPYAI